MDHKSVFARYPLPAILVAPDRTLVAFNDLMLDYHTKRDGSDDVLRATVGQDWTGLSPTPALKAQGRAFHEEVFSTDGVAVTEWRMPGDAESPVFGRYWGRRVVEGDTVTGAVLVREDISRAIEHEHLARRSQILFQLLAERIEDIVLFMDVDGTVISCKIGRAHV